MYFSTGTKEKDMKLQLNWLFKKFALFASKCFISNLTMLCFFCHFNKLKFRTLLMPSHIRYHWAPYAEFPVVLLNSWLLLAVAEYSLRPAPVCRKDSPIKSCDNWVLNLALASVSHFVFLERHMAQRTFCQGLSKLKVPTFPLIL